MYRLLTGVAAAVLLTGCQTISSPTDFGNDPSTAQGTTTLEVKTKLTYLDVHQDFLPAFDIVDDALSRISTTPVDSDISTGKLIATVEGALVTYEIFPIPHGDTRIIMDPKVESAPTAEESLMYLSRLQDEFI